MDNENLKKLIRYAIVGAASNLSLYILYLIVVYLGVLPEIATSLAFATGVTITYLANRSWTFKNTARHMETAPRYVLAYGAGYLIQITLLAFSYRVLKIPHEISQILAMGAAAVLIFTILNFWVFKKSD